MNSRSRKRVGAGVLIASAIAVVVLFFVFFNPFGGGGNSSAEEMNDGQKMAGNGGQLTNPCEQPDDFFELRYQQHTGGFIIDDGLPVDEEEARLKIEIVSAQDPTVLRYFANAVFNRQHPDKYGIIPEDTDLTILAQRKEEWQRLCQFLTLPDLVFVSVVIEGEIQNHVMSVTGVVGTSTDQTTPGERGLAIYFVGEESKAVVLRNLCSNMVTKTEKPIVLPTPRKEVPNTPTNTTTPPVSNTATPPAKDTPTNTSERPTATLTPKNTPTNTPPQSTSTPQPTQTPAPTFTPPAPCCPTAELNPPAEGETPIRPTATPRPTRTPLPEPTQDRSDPVLPTPVSVF